MKKFNLSISLVMALVMMAMCPQKMWGIVVATVTIDGQTTNYTDFHYALLDAEKGTAETPATIKLYQSITFLLGELETITSGVMVIDLNGNTISGENYVHTESGFYYGALLYVNGGDVTITDRTICKYGTITNKRAEAIRIDKGALKIYAGTFHGGETKGSGLVVNGGSVELYGGHYSTGSKDVSAVYNESQTSALANKYGFFDSDGNSLEENTSGYIMSSDKYVADITVKKTKVTEASLTIGGETTYGTVEDIFSAASAGTTASPAVIKLLEDVKLDDYETVTFKDGVATLDLNGKAISGNSNDCSLHVYDDADFTITDTSEGKNGSISNSVCDAVEVEGCTFTIHAGTFNGGIDNGCGMNAYQATVKLDGGHYTTQVKNYAAVAFYECESSALAQGYVFCDADDNILEDTYIDAIHAYNSSEKYDYADDVTVKSFALVCPVSVTVGGTTTYCASMTDALTTALTGTAATPATIKMLRDITLKDQTLLEFDKGVVTLDLNGKTISGNAVTVLKLSNDGNLTVTDTSDDMNGTVKNTGVDDALDTNGGTLTVHAGTFIGGSEGYGIYVLYNTTATLDGGTYKTSAKTDYGAIFTLCEETCLASGYGYYDANGNLLKENTNGNQKALNGTDYATDVTVKAVYTGVEVIENGKLKVEDSAVYNLAGQRVSAGANGLVIKNGKKYFNK